MSTTIDRYVWGVLRAVPPRQRPELEPEIRALIGDAVEARTATGADPAAAEWAALTELGDPERLAARYTEQPLYLIGPRHFLDYRRLLYVLLPIVVSAVALAVALGGALRGAAPLELLALAAGAAISAAMQVFLWVTIGFAILDRSSSRVSPTAWTPDRLPPLPGPASVSKVDLAFTVAANLFVIVLLASLVVEDRGRPLFDPAAWTWLPWFIGVAAAEIAFTVALLLVGRWTWTLAGINALLGAAFAVPAIWLIAERQLLSAEVMAEIGRVADGAWFGPSMAVTAVIIGAITAWDALDGFLKARRSGSVGPALPTSWVSTSDRPDRQDG
ncbi:MAG TPA: permease prefix domain 1-containing protein [Patescibacteria group bacterium]|nr:permease prefix domain 1-containing protein [Patescibacteria group bacterium]